MRHITEDDNISSKEIKNLLIFVGVFCALFTAFLLYITVIYTIYDFLVWWLQ